MGRADMDTATRDDKPLGRYVMRKLTQTSRGVKPAARRWDPSNRYYDSCFVGRIFGSFRPQPEFPHPALPRDPRGSSSLRFEHEGAVSDQLLQHQRLSLRNEHEGQRDSFTIVVPITLGNSRLQQGATAGRGPAAQQARPEPSLHRTAVRLQSGRWCWRWAADKEHTAWKGPMRQPHGACPVPSAPILHRRMVSVECDRRQAVT